MNTGERILHELEKRDIPKNVLATAIGVSATTIGKWDVNNDIKFQNIIKTSKYLNVSLDYLAYGKENTKLSDVENEMLENFRQLPPNEQQQFIGRCKEILDRISSENRKNIQLVSVDILDKAFGAGNTTIYEDDFTNRFHTEKFPRDSVPFKTDKGIIINGDSMSPLIPDGSIVWIEEMHNKEDFKYNDVVVCIFEGIPLCKIYKEDGLHSYNPQYKTIHIDENNTDNLKFLGKVIGVYSENSDSDIDSENQVTVAARSLDNKEVAFSDNIFTDLQHIKQDTDEY